MNADTAPDAVPARFAVITRSTLPEEIAKRMLAQIKEQQLRPGDKLPPERDLARMLDVSRPVVREALRALALMRVVDIRPGDGTYITALEPEQLISHLDIVFSKDSVALVQLLEARRVIEAGNVRLAATRIGDPEIAALETLLGTLEDALDEPERFAEQDIALHVAVCAATGNFLLMQFMNILGTLGRVSRERTGAARDVREGSLADHRRIIDALRAHDPDAGERAMLAHLDHVAAAIGGGA